MRFWIDVYCNVDIMYIQLITSFWGTIGNLITYREEEVHMDEEIYQYL